MVGFSERTILEQFLEEPTWIYPKHGIRSTPTGKTEGASLASAQDDDAAGDDSPGSDWSGESDGSDASAAAQSQHCHEWSRSKFLCDAVLEGRLFGQRILLVTTGIGSVRAATCITTLLK